MVPFLFALDAGHVFRVPLKRWLAPLFKTLSIAHK